MLLTSIAMLLSSVPLSGAGSGDGPDFSGIWIEVSQHSGPAMRLRLDQSGSRVEVRITANEQFPDKVFGVATIENGTAIWSGPQSCVGRFQSPGYSYDDPSVNRFKLSLSPAAPGEEPLLVFVEETQWKAPCGGHPIGVERIERTFKRR